MPSLGVYKRILYLSGWASQVLFITYTIIEGLVGPVLVHNLDHAFTGCVQKDIVSVRLGIRGVIHYIYNHRRFGWACACAQSRPCLHRLCTKGCCMGQVGHQGCYSLHIQSSMVWLGLCLCTISTMPSLVVYKGILYRSGWASGVLFITYTIIDGLVGPVLVHNLDHAFTGCVLKDIVSVRFGIRGVIHYIYNHRRFGWACACAQSRPCLHWLCKKGYCIGQVGHQGCYSLHIQSSTVWLGLCLCTISTMPSLAVYKEILYRSGWASGVLLITYTIIDGLVGPVLVHNLDHAFTGCVQKDIVLVRLGITGVIHYIYNHQGFGWACACAQSRPCLHPLCTKGFCMGQVGRHGCYSLHI